MESISKAWEDAWMRGEVDVPCIHAESCKGVTARTVHGKTYGKPLRRFQTPGGRTFDRCVLCIRAAVSDAWYSVLYHEDVPTEPIHPWTVHVDVPGGYDSALCIGPLREYRYVGVVGPFMRYDESTLIVVPDGFIQVCVDYQRIPRFTMPSERVGARPLGFHHLWRTTSALFYAGFVSHVKERHVFPGVCTVYHKCLSNSYHGRTEWHVNPTLRSWIHDIVTASQRALYPHCASKLTDEVDTVWDLKHVMLFVREHITFLVERDSPELVRAVMRMYPAWPRYAAEVRSMCDALRAHQPLARMSIRTRLEPSTPWSHFVRTNFTGQGRDGASDDARIRILRDVFDARGPTETMSWIRHSLLADEADRMRQAVVQWIHEDRFASRPITDPRRRTDPVTWYVCSGCGDFKSITTAHGGCVHVAFDLVTQTPRCKPKRGGGRKRVLDMLKSDPSLTVARVPTCRAVVIGRVFGVNVVHIQGLAYAACTRCRESRISLTHVMIMQSEWICPSCVRASAPPPTCEACTERVSKDAFRIRVFDHANGVHDAYFCRSHAQARWNKHADVWQYDLLMQRVFGTSQLT